VGRAASRDPLAGQVQRFLDYLTVERGLSTNTIDAYRRELARYAGFLARNRKVKDAAKVREDDVAAFVAMLSSTKHGDPKKPYRTSTVARALASVRSFHQFLVREQEVSEDPTGGVDRPKVPRNLPRPLSVDEVERVLASPAGAEPAALRDRAVLEVLYGAGLRISELIALDVDDLDLEEGSIRVIGKGDKQREVPLGRFAREAVGAYLAGGRPAMATRASRAALFLNQRDGDRLTRQGCAKIIRFHVGRAKIAKRVTPHTFRHSYATHLLEGGADVRVVQELLGHASVSTTQVYTLVTQEHLREAYFSAHPRGRKTKSKTKAKP